jgi:hypothetical protein
VLQAFSIYDNVDDSARGHGIYACSSFGPDFENLPDAAPSQRQATADTIQNATYEIGWWDEGRTIAAADIRSAAKQLRLYLAGGYGSTNNSQVLYARSGRAAVGLYMGAGLHNDGVNADALKTLEDNLQFLNTSSRSVGLQFCEPDYTSDHIFGFFATSNRTFAPVQQAIQSWSNASCLSFPNSQNFTGEVTLSTPLVTANPINSTISTNSTAPATRKRSIRAKLHARAECNCPGRLR